MESGDSKDIFPNLTFLKSSIKSLAALSMSGSPPFFMQARSIAISSKIFIASSKVSILSKSFTSYLFRDLG